MALDEREGFGQVDLVIYQTFLPCGTRTNSQQPTPKFNLHKADKALTNRVLVRRDFVSFHNDNGSYKHEEGRFNEKI